MNANFAQATGAYNDALRAATRILDQMGGVGGASGASESSGVSKGGFFDMVGGALKDATATGYKSEEMATKALSGKADLTDVIAAVSSAENSLGAVVAIRDKVISAYQDIIKMPM